MLTIQDPRSKVLLNLLPFEVRPTLLTSPHLSSLSRLVSSHPDRTWIVIPDMSVGSQSVRITEWSNDTIETTRFNCILFYSVCIAITTKN